MKLYELWNSRAQIEDLMQHTSSRLNLSQDERTEPELSQLMSEVGGLLDTIRSDKFAMSKHVDLIAQVLANIPTVPNMESLQKAKDTLQLIVSDMK